MEKLNVAATGRWLSLVCASFGMLIAMPRAANAQSALTWARIELTRNQVQLFTNGQSRRAQVSDMLRVGDALRTARRARAELRFNDGSLARIGESAVFQFTPETRNFRLSNGTVLLLIPPGQGRTTIQTPNAVTGIRGSALFVRFVPETSTTIIGALTNNPEGPMMAFSQDGSQQQPLYAGEMAVLRGDGSLERFTFELETFYETSDLVVGLQIENLDVETGDAAIDAVRQEIKEALEQQNSFEDDENVMENPSFLSSRFPLVTPDESGAATSAVPDFSVSPAAAFLQRDIGAGFESVVSATVNQPGTEQMPTTQPPVTQPVEPTPPAAAPPIKPPAPVAVPPTPAPTPAAAPPTAGPLPGAVPTPPIAKPPTPIVPETNSVEPPVLTVPPETTVPEPAPAPIDPPEIVTPPAPTVPTPELITPPIDKPVIPIEPVAPTAPTAETPVPETVIPPTETLGELDLIESVLEPETEVQIERLPTGIAPETSAPPATSSEVAPEIPSEAPPATAL